MKVTYLGQAGLLFETHGIKICVDPYLSDSCASLSPKNRRRVPVNAQYLKPIYDVLIFTHNHMDHADPETYPHLLSGEKPVTVLASYDAWQAVRKSGGNHNYVMFNCGTTWTEHGVKFKAVYAEHSDPYAIGVLIDDGEKTYYVTGDTLYNEKVLADLPEHIDVLFLPVNGVGNNMNFEDGKAFAQIVGAGKTVPLHIGLFDSLTADAWDVPGKVIPEIYREIHL